MADSTVATSSQALSEEQYKALCKQVRQHQLAKSNGRKRTKPILKPIGDINVIDLKARVQKSPCDWDDIKNGMPFALDPQGTLIYTKASATKAFCLNTMSTVPVGGASVYRIFL
jgi:hypothetical protein